MLMQQLLQLKKEPEDPVSTEILFDLNPMKESFGEESTELKDLLSILFTPSFLLELREETKSLDITIDDEEKKLILRLKKKTKSKSLLKKGRVYALRKELKMTNLTLIYNYQPDYLISNELQPTMQVEPMMNFVKPLEMNQPKTMISDIPKLPVKPSILIDNPDDMTIVLNLPEYTDNLSQELPNKNYEEQFKPLTSENGYFEVDTELNTDNYSLVPEKIVRPEDLAQKYRTDLTVQTQPQSFEGELGGVQVIDYNIPIPEDGEYVYKRIRMRATDWTTVYDMLKQSGIPFEAVYNKKFNGMYVPSIYGVREDSNKYWEVKINGHYASTSFDKAIVKPGDVVDFVLKTASSSPCGQPTAG